MANRVVNGNQYSENGWPLVDEGSCTWLAIPGTGDTVHLEIQNGQPLAIMGAFAAAYHAFVMPIFENDSACWTLSNSVLGQPGRNNGSNHLGGTAMDLRWLIHRFQISYDGYSPDQIAVVRELLDFFEGMIFWGEDWGLQGVGPFDCMHFQMGYDTYGSQNVGRVQDFINRKIRADGFSTFRQGAPPPPPPPPPPVLSRADRYALAIITEGQKLGITPRGNKIAISVGLVESSLRNLANSNDPASLQLPNDGVGSDHLSVGWAQQQPNWGSLQCRMDITCAATLFFTCDNGPGTRGLTKIRVRNNGEDGPLYDYNDESRTPGFYAQKVQGSAFPDRYDQRFADAEVIYNRLLAIQPPPPPPPPPEGFLMALSDLEQHEILDNARASAAQRKSRSPLRHWGEGTVGDVPDQIWDMDGSIHVLVVYLLARLGDPSQLALLHEVANGDPATDPGREHDKDMALQILADLGSPPPPPVVPPPSTAVAVIPPEVLPPTTDVDTVTGNPGADDVLSALDSLGKFDTRYRTLFDQLTKGKTS